MNLNREEGNQYKRGWWEAIKEDCGNHYDSPYTKKSSSDRAKDQPSKINSVHLCLTVMNTIITVICALRPSSSTHSLQIYCTGLTGPRSHTSWAWAAKCDPTYSYIVQLSINNIIHSNNNKMAKLHFWSPIFWVNFHFGPKIDFVTNFIPKKINRF